MEVVDVFIESQIKLTKRVNYKFQLKNKEIQDFDTYIVGSDQVWRNDYALDMGIYFFDFVTRTKILASYAASFGKESWSYSADETSSSTKLVKCFSHVSVRENSAIKLCNDKLDVIAESHLDPTLLVDLSRYQEIINKYDGSNSTNSTNTPKNIFCYFLDSNKKKSQVAELVKNHFNIEVNTFDNNITQKLNFGEWLNSFKSSKFVITDSFHGVVFSLIFRKQFIAIGNKGRGLSRFKTILNITELAERLIIDDYSKVLTSILK